MVKSIHAGWPCREVVVRLDGASVVTRVGDTETWISWPVLKEAAAQEDRELAEKYSAILEAAIFLKKSQEAMSSLSPELKEMAATFSTSKAALGLLEAFLQTPLGGWPETVQAWERLCEYAPEGFEVLESGKVHKLGLALGIRAHASRS